MNKNRIRGLPGRTSERVIAKSTAIKGREGKSGGDAAKAVGLTSGGLRRVRKSRTEAGPQGPVTAAQKSWPTGRSCRAAWTCRPRDLGDSVQLRRPAPEKDSGRSRRFWSESSRRGAGRHSPHQPRSPARPARFRATMFVRERASLGRPDAAVPGPVRAPRLAPSGGQAGRRGPRHQCSGTA